MEASKRSLLCQLCAAVNAQIYEFMYIALELRKQYFTDYGLALRGLLKHHSIDPLEYGMPFFSFLFYAAYKNIDYIAHSLFFMECVFR